MVHIKGGLLGTSASQKPPPLLVGTFVQNAANVIFFPLTVIALLCVISVMMSGLTRMIMAKL